ncbi:(deoxy)nucleoside triphosphate pyrophosphohydrolase [Auritidibacter ignavus]|uniref:8-oxo-dGTP diphosphatase n=1 Tax=Auritidibacter ignavus TaxID=678932 RepID=A0AAJ6AL52_9MICC|nr:(deoxy)nucleoside triphosphate pyrophosphohydrolase [Auritidibacter ignavus]WGH91624.1 (deoxy)nucleoside triphosphate pyrophosphohydrolase [Auritidibacter ignavus]WGH94052.1 (deoxy)nucleoside triphosphate pyrophosphohydrolase [Auritidibacter ignavus]WHS34576.1 (deoxy)nucleoside triphosphate pyrophosphohydrolase [Auritidibacter ignavus]
MGHHPHQSSASSSLTDSNSRRVVVGAAILDDKHEPGQMMLARRKAPKSLAGYWEFPGGKVEAGEDLEQALRRELQEELDVEAEILDRIESPEPQGWLLGNGMRMQVYTAVIISGKATALVEHDQLAWEQLDSTALHAFEWIPADRPIVDALLEQLSR